MRRLRFRPQVRQIRRHRERERAISAAKRWLEDVETDSVFVYDDAGERVFVGHATRLVGSSD